MKKKVIFMIIGIFILIVSILLFLHFSKDNKQFNENIEFKNPQNLYNNIKIDDFIKDIKCTKDCYLNGEKINYNIDYKNNIGYQKVTLNLNYKGEKTKKEFNINLVDNIAPELILTEYLVEIKINDELNPMDYIEKVTDNFDKDLLSNIKIDSQLDNKKVGEYSIIYTITDKSNNSTEKILKVIVKDNSKPTSINNSKPNNNSNKPIKNETNNNSEKPSDTTDSSNNNNTINIIPSKEEIKTDFKSNINKVTLKPLEKSLNGEASIILNSIIKPNMSNYEKVLAIYTYIHKNIKPGKNPTFTFQQTNALFANSKLSYNDTYIRFYAGITLATKEGNNEFPAALFILMTRQLGIESYMVKESEKPFYRRWAIIKVNNMDFIFSPMSEKYKCNASNCEEYFKYFGLNSNDATGFFENYEVLLTNNFQEIISPSAINELSGAINKKDIKSILNPNEIINVKLNDEIHIKTNITGNKLYTYSITINDKEIIKQKDSINTFEYDYQFNEKKLYNIEINITDRHSNKIFTYRYKINVE